MPRLGFPHILCDFRHKYEQNWVIGIDEGARTRMLAWLLLRDSVPKAYYRATFGLFNEGLGMTENTNNGMDAQGRRVRHARMRIETTVLLNRGTESFPTELEDISATGVRLRKPSHWNGEVGQTWVVDMIFGSNLHIHVDARVMRISTQWIGLEYSRIPENKQETLWSLLGGYADKLEPWEEENL
jgi:hypothetical protein